MTTDPTDSFPGQESERLAVLASYAIMDTAPEGGFDDIVRIAAQICDAPMALISLVDDKRQWFKAALGVSAAETPREMAFCAHAIQQREIFQVEDATRDERFAHNPLVAGAMGLRFYAGAPLETPSGHALGTLCVLDTKPAALTADQQLALAALARQVVAQLELRKALARQSSSEERQRQILASAIDYAIISMDLAGLVTSWNQGAQNILGWSQEEMCDRPCDDFFTPEDCAAGAPAREMGQALSAGRGSDERWHLRKSGERFWASGEMMVLTDDAGTPVGFLKILRDRTEFRRAEEALRASQEAAARDTKMLSNELAHRVKNTLAMVQAIVGQSLRRASTPAEAATVIEERLISLARANDVLTRTNWLAAPIANIVGEATQVLAVEPSRVQWDGPDIGLNARAALGLALVIHELSTNAVKYGALSNAVGEVHIGWRVIDEGFGDMFHFTWREVGGPSVAPPSREGFGSRLIKTSLSGGPAGCSSVDYLPEGLVFKTQTPLSLVKDL